LLKKGQIKFTKTAAIVAEKIFKAEKTNEFLIAAEGNKKPPGSKDIYISLIGTKQNSASEIKVYTKNISKAEKFFEMTLFKNNQLGLIFSPTYSCALIISKSEQPAFDSFKKSNHQWPTVRLHEGGKDNLKKFENEMKQADAVDLPVLIKKINEEPKE
jgi:hypothetical protein